MTVNRKNGMYTIKMGANNNKYWFQRYSMNPLCLLNTGFHKIINNIGYFYDSYRVNKMTEIDLEKKWSNAYTNTSS